MVVIDCTSSAGRESGRQSRPALRVRRDSFCSVVVVFLWLILGVVYVQYLVLPYLRGESGLYVYLGDSFTYRDQVSTGLAGELAQALGGGGYTMGQFNLTGMALWAALAELISHEHFDYVIVFLNLGLLAVAMRNYLLVFRFYEARTYPKFMLLMVLNPYTVACLCNVSKEIWGLFFVSCFLRYGIYRKTVRYLAAVVVSFFVRDAYAMIGLMFLIIRQVKVNKAVYLVALSLIVPYVLPEGQVSLLIGGQDEKSLGISLLLAKIQAVPLGYVITYVPKVLLSAFADLSPLRIVKASDNVIGNLSSLSAALTFVLCASFCLRKSFERIRCDEMLFNFGYAYTLVAATTAFIHYRYLFPLYPVIVMAVLIKARERGLQEDREDIRVSEGPWWQEGHTPPLYFQGTEACCW